MNCYFVWDEEHQHKILIPGCYGGLHTNDLSQCSCKSHNPPRITMIEKELKDEIVNLRKENNQLLRILEKLTKREIK